MIRNKLTAQAVVEEARSWIGTPYIHQASIKNIGCDCLGLVRGIWRELVGEEPRATPAYSADWAESGGQEQLLAAAEAHFDGAGDGQIRPGDVLLFRMRAKSPAKHLGIFAGNDRFIHAYDGASVVESAMGDFWHRCLVKTFRFPGVSH